MRDFIRSFTLGAIVVAATAAVTAQQPQPAAQPAAQPPAAQQPQLPKPSFATKAEIVLVDVNVVDRDAKPVPTLTADDFDLEVNGQPRAISSVQFISTVPTNTTAATPRESAYTSNDSQTTGRLLLFVDRSDQLDEPFTDILEELSNQYILGYESKNTARNGTWREVKLEIPGTNYSVRARQGYRAPGS